MCIFACTQAKIINIFLPLNENLIFLSIRQCDIVSLNLLSCNFSELNENKYKSDQTHGIQGN